MNTLGKWSDPKTTDEIQCIIFVNMLHTLLNVWASFLESEQEQVISHSSKCSNKFKQENEVINSSK